MFNDISFLFSYIVDSILHVYNSQMINFTTLTKALQCINQHNQPVYCPKVNWKKNEIQHPDFDSSLKKIIEMYNLMKCLNIFWLFPVLIFVIFILRIYCYLIIVYNVNNSTFKLRRNKVSNFRQWLKPYICI